MNEPETPIAERLEYLRTELRAERISYGELIELQGLVEHIPPGDLELLEAAGVPEFEEDYIEVVYEVTVMVHADDPIPEEDRIQQAIYQSDPHIRTPDAVEVRRC